LVFKGMTLRFRGRDWAKVDSGMGHEAFPEVAQGTRACQRTHIWPFFRAIHLLECREAKVDHLILPKVAVRIIHGWGD
jgi:hypothetical protein